MTLKVSKISTTKTKKSIKAEINLKRYQLTKYGQCFACKEPIPRICNFVCPKCGYNDI